MKADDELRRELDKVVPFRPEAKRDKAGKAGSAPRQLSTVWADEIAFDLDTSGLVDGLLASTGMTVLYGESGSGKTFVAVDLACHVAAGLPWRGMGVEQGVAVYVAAESPESVKRRVWAWKRRHGVDRLPVLVVQSAVDLLNGDAEALAGLLEKLKAEHGRVALVVVDTLARAMTGNENAPDDMGRFVAACGRLREAGDTHILTVHHAGKDLARGARGHSSLRAATDVELEVTNGEGGGTVRVTKHRDEAGGASYGFELEQVELGQNAKGRVVTTCVAVACDPPARATGGAAARPLGGNEKIVFEALVAAIVDHGEPAPPACDVPPMEKVAPVARWQDAAMRYLPQPEAKRRNEAFNRALASLVGSGRVRHVAGYAWIGGGRAGRMRSHEAACDRHATDAAGSHGSRVSLDTRPCDHATAGEAGEAEAGAFIPTTDWQEVPEGAVLPPGCEVRTDFGSGRNEARRVPA